MMVKVPALALSFPWLVSAALLTVVPGCKKAERRDGPSASPAAAPTGTAPAGAAPSAAAPMKAAPPLSDQAVAKGELPPGHPPIDQMPARQPAMGMPSGAPGAVDAPPAEGKGLSWSLPAAWKARKPRTAMRKAEIGLPGQAAADEAELVVFHFPGTGGSVDANLERWYAQFQSPTNKKSEKRTVNGLKVTLASVTGVFQKPKDPSQMSGPTEPAPHYGMLAAIVETAQGPWFFKAIGPKATLDAHAANFDTFVASFKQ